MVLLADRDAASAEAVRRALGERVELTLETCAEPERVCEVAAATGAAVILLAASSDLMELGVLRRLVAGPTTSGLPVVVLAHRASPEARAGIFSAGAADCFTELPEACELAVRLGNLARSVLAERERDEARRELVELQKRLQAEGDAGLGSGGIASRRRLDEFLDGEWRRARRNGSHLSLVLVEAAAREGQLADLASALKAALRRGGDLLASYGAGRFAAVLPEVGAAGAATVAEALRRAARTAAPEVSLRLGVASLRPQEAPASGPRTLLAQAEAALG